MSHFFLGVSKSSSPTTTGSSDWYFYSFDAALDGSTPTTNWADFPGLGLDDDVVVLTANMFSFSNGFQYAKIRILDKSVLIAGGSVTWTDFVDMTDPSSGLKAFTLQPALTFGSPGTFFLISASSSSTLCDHVVWGIENALSSPTLTSQVAAASGTCTVTLSANRTVTATFSKSFTDDPLSAQVTPVKKVHITDLREAINTLRSNNGLSAYSYTDSTLTAGTTQAKVVHITDLRTALNGVYDAKSRTRPSYTDSTITAGQTIIKKAHMAEIRSAVRDVE